MLKAPRPSTTPGTPKTRGRSTFTCCVRESQIDHLYTDVSTVARRQRPVETRILLAWLVYLCGVSIVANAGSFWGSEAFATPRTSLRQARLLPAR